MKTCRHCARTIVSEHGVWIDPDAPVDGDDSVWRETCDASPNFIAEHEPEAECSQCDDGEAEVVEHGMCSSCLHNAYRSGWQPGSEV